MASVKRCFVIMPISNPEGYESGHFDRVYRQIIRPACTKAGFEAVRADEVNMTNYIVANILGEIINADMALCDLSTRNPNVMYELGIRHAFNKPITLIRDTRTSRVFDIQGLRDLEYDASLRIDNALEVIDMLAERLKNTYDAPTNEVTSPIQLLKVPTAKVEPTKVSPETSLVLSAIEQLSDRMEKVERDAKPLTRSTTLNQLRNSLIYNARLPTPPPFPVIEHPRYGRGRISAIIDSQAIVRFDDGMTNAVDLSELVYMVNAELPKDDDDDNQVAATKE